ncbi:unnamed protein product [Mytilus coruscus]|uniref:G-protein coupled receptors family 1 profile domain-containing protein n=1 Tax=Mytilus coruscus TaxID=42192 RepID=A0A6J8EV23_MYTCO|nr:unnamed protein product [Mytilus coruscus]
MSNATFDDKTLQDISNDFIQKMIGPVVFLVICLFLGVPGNITVLVIYGRRYSTNVYRSIIWNLALADLMFCSFGITFDIARIFKYYSFKKRWICSMGVSLLVFGMLYSSHLLILPSVHRFRQVCMSLRPQMTQQSIKYWIIGCFLAAIIFTSPKPELQFHERINITNNITGHICPITSSRPSIYAVIYSYFLLLLFASYAVILVIIYLAIGIRMYIQYQDRRRKSLNTIEENISCKMTKITLTVSILFTLSYLPVFLFQITQQSIQEDKFSSVQITLLRIIEQCYVINHVANPFIYSIFDERFRKNFIQLVSMKFVKPEKMKTNVSASAVTASSVVLDSMI